MTLSVASNSGTGSKIRARTAKTRVLEQLKSMKGPTTQFPHLRTYEAPRVLHNCAAIAAETSEFLSIDGIGHSGRFTLFADWGDPCGGDVSVCHDVSEQDQLIRLSRWPTE